MRPHTDSRTNGKFHRRLVVAVTIAASALGWWIVRGDRTPLPRGAAPAGADRVDVRAPAPATIVYDELGYADLLDLLAKNLPHDAAVVPAALMEIAATRPELAIELAQTLGRSREEKAAWVVHAMTAWAARDPRLAWQWLGSQAWRIDELAHGSLPGLVLDLMAARDPEMVVQSLDAVLRGDASAGGAPPPVALQLGVRALVRSGDIEIARNAVETWARDSIAPNLQASAFDTVALAIGARAPEEAGAWLKSLPVSEERNAAIATFASDWGSRDPVTALRWTEELGYDENRTRSIQRIFAEWVERDASAAVSWFGRYVRRASETASVDQMIGSLINFSSTMKQDAQLGLEWSSLISDLEQRKIHEENVVLRWARRDFAAAVDYVWKSPVIAADEKPALIQKFQTQPPSDLFDDF